MHYVETAAAKGEDAAALQIACAAHLPEITAIVGPQRWMLLQPALKILAGASEPVTRAALAGNLHRLAQALPDRECRPDLLATTEVCY